MKNRFVRESLESNHCNIVFEKQKSAVASQSSEQKIELVTKLRLAGARAKFLKVFCLKRYYIKIRSGELLKEIDCDNAHVANFELCMLDLEIEEIKKEIKIYQQKKDNGYLDKWQKRTIKRVLTEKQGILNDLFNKRDLIFYSFILKSSSTMANFIVDYGINGQPNFDL